MRDVGNGFFNSEKRLSPWMMCQRILCFHLPSKRSLTKIKEQEYSVSIFSISRFNLLRGIQRIFCLSKKSFFFCAYFIILAFISCLRYFALSVQPDRRLNRTKKISHASNDQARTVCFQGYDTITLRRIFYAGGKMGIGFFQYDVSHRNENNIERITVAIRIKNSISLFGSFSL